MNEGQLYDAAEREMDLYRAEVTRVTAERDALRAVAAEILGTFSDASGDGYRARVGQVQIARWHERAGLPS